MPRWILCLSLLPAAAISTSGVTVSVMGFNIRYGTSPDGEDSWVRRRDLLFEVLRQANPDFVGLQEALDFQIDQALAAIPGYTAVGAGRDHGAREGEHSSTLYRDDRRQTDVSETFCLSDTPEVPGSRSWGSRIPGSSPRGGLWNTPPAIPCGSSTLTSTTSLNPAVNAAPNCCHAASTCANPATRLS